MREAVPWTPSRALQRALDVYPEVLASGAQLEGAQAYAEGAGALLSPSMQLAATLGDADENSNTLRQRVELGGAARPALRPVSVGHPGGPG